MDEEIQMCFSLLRGDELPIVKPVDDPISPQLASDYGKILTARKLGAALKSIITEAALCRCALTNDEDDRVRVECLQQLLNHRSHLLDAVLLGLLFDPDEEMRLAAIEGLALTRSANLKHAASIVANDKSERVRESMANISSGHPISLYFLDVSN
jgi:HEAT repeat protein